MDLKILKQKHVSRDIADIIADGHGVYNRRYRLQIGGHHSTHKSVNELWAKWRSLSTPLIRSGAITPAERLMVTAQLKDTCSEVLFLLAKELETHGRISLPVEGLGNDLDGSTAE